jgi:hypothetical protein
LKQLGVRDHIDPQLLVAKLDSLQWDSGQLIQFLCKEKLDDIELEKLRHARVWTGKQKSVSISGAKFTAGELYIPSDELDGFQVLQLDVTIPLKPMSKEIKFLQRIGMQRTLSSSMIVEAALCTNDDEERFKLLEYSAKHHTLTDTTSSYLPSQTGKLMRANSLFMESNGSILGFFLLHPRLISLGAKFSVREKPPISEVIQRLKERRPSKENAQDIFDYLQSRMSEFKSHDIAHLQEYAFIPTKSGYFPPNRVYFNPFPLLENVDFGNANQFLRMCGVKDEPTAVEMAEWLMSYGSSVFESKPKEYLEILTKVAFNVSILSSNRNLMQRMQRSKLLIGHFQTSQQLVSPGEVYLVDDPVLQNIFQPITCPMEPILEQLYESLGSKWLTHVVDARYDIGLDRKVNPKCENLLSLIQERAPLLVHDMNNNRSIRSKALEQLGNVRVFEVSSLQLVRKFKEQKHTQVISACMSKEDLLISGEVDYFDVSKGLSHLIFNRPRLNDVLLLSTLLSTSLDMLRQKGKGFLSVEIEFSVKLTHLTI